MPVRSFEPINPARDVTRTRTFLHEVIPITGSIISGTYVTGDTENNIKNYTHGMFQSVYDYPFLSSSANHIFDITAGYAAASSLSSSTSTQNSKKINMYNEFAQVLLGYTGSKNDIRQFESDLTLDQVNQMSDVFIISLSRLLIKDEIKKGSFQMEIGRGSYGDAFNGGIASGKATATLVVTNAGGVAHGETFTLVDSAGTSTVYTINGGVASASGGGSGGSATVGYDGVGGGAGGKVLAAAAIAAAINNTTDANYTAVSDGTDKVTVTQGTVGTVGNKTNTDAIGGVTVGNFTGGGATDLTLGDYVADPDGTGVLNCDGGDMSVLFTGSAADSSIGDIGYGAIFYQAGVVVLTSSLFDNVSDFGSANQFIGGGTTPNLTAEQTLIQSSISGACDAFRHRIKSIQFNNTTELNSTIYFCRAPANKFNYSSNPSYVTGSKIRVKNLSSDNPVAYVTTVGLYSASNELLAVAKLSEPLKKSVDNELTIRVRLDY